MNILLDTCVISDLRHGKSGSQAYNTVTELPAEALFMSVITVGEIVKGVTLLAEGRKKREMIKWFRELDDKFADHVVGIDRDTARIWGEITARGQKKGLQIPAADGLIAATALQHGMHIMTRNTKHFSATGALVIDPWQKT